jgi:hypothetical protein
MLINVSLGRRQALIDHGVDPHEELVAIDFPGLQRLILQ